jgi:hypothetical protein
MRILVIHQYFPDVEDIEEPDWYKMLHLWAQQGHEIVVLAGMVNETTGCKVEKYQGRLWVTERIGSGAKIRRCHVSPRYRRNAAARFRADMSFAMSSLLAGMGERRPDVLICGDDRCFSQTILASPHGVRCARSLA